MLQEGLGQVSLGPVREGGGGGEEVEGCGWCLVGQNWSEGGQGMAERCSV